MSCVYTLGLHSWPETLGHQISLIEHTHGQLCIFNQSFLRVFWTLGGKWRALHRRGEHAKSAPKASCLLALKCPCWTLNIYNFSVHQRHIIGCYWPVEIWTRAAFGPRGQTSDSVRCRYLYSTVGPCTYITVCTSVIIIVKQVKHPSLGLAGDSPSASRSDEISFLYFKSWASTSLNLTTSLALIGRGSVKGQTQHGNRKTQQE